MLRRATIVGLAVSLSLLGAVSPQPASAAGPVRAVMHGRPISLARARSLSCHDFDYPVLTCFATAGEMQAAAATRARSAPTRLRAGTAAVATTGYVVVYVDGAYAGSARALSQDYSYLGTIGWNDVISSLKSYGASGHFWENSPSGGFIYYFYATTQVSYVGDFYNDKFSAVYFT
jgi:hypothetical protein